jgi:hypothetical protein
MTEPNRAQTTEAPPVGHETSDVRIMPLVQFGVALAVLTFVVFIGMWALQKFFEGRERRLKQSELPLAVGERGRQPPVPRLEGINLDYAKTRARLETARRPSLTPLQATAIEKAIQELEDKLPVRAEPPDASRRPSADANSGRGNPKESP